MSGTGGRKKGGGWGSGTTREGGRALGEKFFQGGDFRG